MDKLFIIEFKSVLGLIEDIFVFVGGIVVCIGGFLVDIFLVVGLNIFVNVVDGVFERVIGLFEGGFLVVGFNVGVDFVGGVLVEGVRYVGGCWWICFDLVWFGWLIEIEKGIGVDEERRESLKVE